MVRASTISSLETRSSNPFLTFAGTDIAIYGNATGGMAWTASIDGTNTKQSSSDSGVSSELVSWSGLASGEHLLTLSTTPAASGSTFTIDHAEVTVGLGVR